MTNGRANPPSAVDPMADISLRILATTDLHGCLIAWDYFTHSPALGRGLAAISSLVTAARRENANALLLDNGDFLNGSGLGDYMAALHLAPMVHPMIAAMNSLGYDAVTLGNHEFSHGLGHLQHALKDARFALVNSNFDLPDLPSIHKTLLLPRALRDNGGRAHQVTIGVIGLLPSQTMIWEAQHLAGRAAAHPMVESARMAAADLRKRGADVVIALAHTGLPNMGCDGGEEGAARAVAQIADIDAVIAGHSHQKYPDHPQVPPEPALALPGFFGSHLAVVDLTLRRMANGWCKIDHQAALRPVAQRDAATGRLLPLVAEDPSVTQIARPTHIKILAQSEQVIGTIPHRLHSYFATVTSSSAMGLIAAAQRDAVAAALVGTAYAGLPILSAAAPFKAGGRGGPENFSDIGAGAFRHHDAADLYMHPNSLVAFRITGAQLRLWLERAVSKYTQILAGDGDVLIHNPGFPSFNCDMVFGVQYCVDISQPPMFDSQGQVVNPSARRIVSLQFQGQDVHEGQQFALASNSFRLDGDAGFAGAVSANVIYRTPELIQSILRSFIAAGKPVPAADMRHWTFAPLPGRSAVLHTSPQAALLADEIAHLRPKALGLDSEGFLRFRLHL